MEDICEDLDIVKISGLFMVLLSNDFIKQNAPQKLKMKESFNLNFLINICHLNNTNLKKVQIVKSVICPIVDFFDLNEELNIEKLEILREQLEKSISMVVHGSPKLKKKVEEIQKRIEELEGLKVDGIDNVNNSKVSPSLFVDIQVLEEFYSNQIHNNIVDLIKDNDEELLMLQTFGNKNSHFDSPETKENTNLRWESTESK